MVRIPGFHCHGPGSSPGRGSEILPAVWHGTKTILQFEAPLGFRTLALKNMLLSFQENKYIK